MTEWWAFLWKLVKKKRKEKAVKKRRYTIRSCLIARKTNGYKNGKHSFIMPGDGEYSITVHSYVCFTFQCLILNLNVHKLEVISKEKWKRSHLFPSFKHMLYIPSKSAHMTSATAKASYLISNGLISCFLWVMSAMVWADTV